MKNLTIFGILISVIWVGAFSCIVCFNLDDAHSMTLNEWGDFLAGGSAPLALLWLVIGYFQHGKELRLNTRVLEMQQEELRHQVEETAHLAKNSERQAEATERLVQITKKDLEREQWIEARNAKPEFVDDGGTFSRDKLRKYLKNRGGEARNVKVHYEGDHLLSFSAIKIFESNARGTLIVRENNSPLTFPIRFQIICTDLLDNTHTMKFEISESQVLKEILIT